MTVIGTSFKTTQVKEQASEIYISGGGSNMYLQRILMSWGWAMILLGAYTPSIIVFINGAIIAFLMSGWEYVEDDGEEE